GDGVHGTSAGNPERRPCSSSVGFPTAMTTRLMTGQFLARAACVAVLSAVVCTMGSAQRPQSTLITITLAGQSMIRSDIRATAPAAVPVIQGLLKGDVVFTNLEAA